MDDIDLTRWRQIDELFAAALDQPPDSRRAFLDTASGGDAELIAEVESLLASLDRAGQAIGDSADELLPVEPPPAPWSPGQRVGAYRVVREIGRGGMGVVYLAERADAEFDRQVAIKVVRPGSTGDRLQARFRAEARILAGLEHPGIARLYDSGVSSGGEPFLVMEYVDGLRIDRYADERRLDIDARLALFDAVCDAVTYAHQRLVVHRDLKPANILIAGDGRPRLLDFGVARLVAADEDEEDPVTRPAQRMLTPEYAAPEQLRGDRVTAAADVYALGVVLHELLVGRRPRRQTRTDRTERDEPARPPSTAMREPADARWDPEAAAAARRTSPAGLRRSCRGDLDTIVLTALAADPKARYQSVELLQQDVRRFRESRPIVARPPGPIGRAVRFARRNPLLVTAAAAALALTVGYVVSLNTQNERIRSERDRAERATEFLVDLFQANDPLAGSRRDTMRVADFITEGSARVETELADQPPLQAALLTALGRAQHALGNLPEARRLIERALDHRASLGPVDLAKALTELGGVAHREGDLDQAETLNREALAIRERTPEGRAGVRINLSNLGLIKLDQGQLDTAAALLDRALALGRAATPVDTNGLAELLNGRSAVAYRANQPELALALNRESLELLRATRDSAHPRVLVQQAQFAFLLDRSGRTDEAVPLMEATLAGLRDRLPPTHQFMLAAATNLGAALGRVGRVREAVDLTGGVVEIERAQMPTSQQRGVALDTWAGLLHQAGRADEAVAAYQELIDLRLSGVGPDHPLTALARTRLAGVQCELPNAPAGWRRAAATFAEGVGLLARTMTPSHPMLLGARAGFAACLMRVGRPDDALAELEPAYVLARDSLTPRHPVRRAVAATLLQVYEATADSGGAAALRLAIDSAAAEPR